MRRNDTFLWHLDQQERYPGPRRREKLTLPHYSRSNHAITEDDRRRGRALGARPENDDMARKTISKRKTTVQTRKRLIPNHETCGIH